MSTEQCKAILNHTVEQLDSLKHADLENSEVQIAIADLFWKAAKECISPESYRLKEWLEDRSSALDWHGEFDMAGNPDRYRRFLEKNIYILKKVVAII